MLGFLCSLNTAAVGLPFVCLLRSDDRPVGVTGDTNSSEQETEQGIVFFFPEKTQRSFQRGR